MSRFIRTLSFRRKKDRVPESSKPHQWQEDERKVRDGTCSFQVRYLGCIEVFESRGMQVCEEAVKALKARKHRSVWSRMSLRSKSRKKAEQNKGKYQRAILYVSGDALRVVDEISKGLIVDQTIEKVSFCAPDRNHEKGFAYICRDGTTRRWMCHAFLAVKESKPPSRWKRFKHDSVDHSVTGERLSHAVGCAFAVCLEKKQKREKDAVSVQFNDKGTSFSRTGSFRQTTLTERLADPQSALVAEPVPMVQTENPIAVQRPKASQEMLIKQGSFRGFTKLSESSPFKRQMSLRVEDLPSTIERQKQLNGPVAPIPEVSPTREREEESISAMCHELTQGLTAMSEDPFSKAPGPRTSGNIAAPIIPQQKSSGNPWGGEAAGSEAEAWLHDTASAVGASLVDDPYIAGAEPYNPVVNGAARTRVAGYGAQYQAMQRQQQQQQQPSVNARGSAVRAPPIGQLRSRTVESAEPWRQQNKGPTLRELSQRKQVVQFQSQSNGGNVKTETWKAEFNGSQNDPFDVAWAARSSNPATTQTNNPFDDKVTTSFKVNL